MYTFHIITLYPEAFESYLKASIVGRAINDKKIKVYFYDPKDFKKKTDKHNRVDNKPYGGGPGMVIEALPVIKAIENARKKAPKAKIIFFTPRGEQFDNQKAEKWANVNISKSLILVCGRYEGIDDRVRKAFKVENVSVGPFVLTGGELPAMIVLDSVARRIKGVLGDENSIEENRISTDRVYTRPEIIEYKGKKYKVPKVLLSGNHKDIEEWKMG
jgi:tRNA (guanine37-N1)-methyltransferase